jgi:hypothetical protein
MAASPRRVLVLGTAFRAGPWTVRALRRAGYDVLGAEAPDPLAGRTLQTPSPLRCPDPVDDPSGLADWIVETCVTRGIRAVLSTDEDMTRVLASVVALPDGTAPARAVPSGTPRSATRPPCTRPPRGSGCGTRLRRSPGMTGRSPASRDPPGR